ncbi:glycosyltransferase family 4 protein [Planococcus sp. 107-1]|uniref:glycosyltransferase family 4 protein n=1 Tax=Planococcus sp. 107-1 TaxID=2908840 RepID=UPI001F2E6F4B|nr:glycosyltransferase family 4 protein [Planococcus sp. 107-1]UJF26174.1 glycosyltransferase family 4 protein [Planococcus sp. 107-1]
MNIIFLTVTDINSIHEKMIYTDLLREFIENGHNVYIVSPSERRYKKNTTLIEEENSQILKVKIGNIQKTNILEKGISTILIENNFKAAIKKHFSNIKFDLVLYSTPPITLVSTIKYLKDRDGAKSYLMLKDIFPQNAVDLNMFSKKNPIYNFFRFKEKRLYMQSDYIGCMSQANVDFVLKHNPNIEAGKVEICPNSIQPLKVNYDKEIRKKYNIPLDKTVFIYGGNLGKPQGIDFLIECLEANKESDKVHFVIAGSGTEFNKIVSYFNVKKPSNAQLFQQLPKEDYEGLANSCDVGLIFLDHRFTIPNFPSRLLSYMQASMPVLAATDPNTDVGQVIENGSFGYWCESNDVKDFNQKVSKLTNKDLTEEMGKNARKYLEENYTPKHSYDVIMSHFE